MADIDSALRQWSSTASSNKPTGATSIGSGLDDNLRAIQAVVRQYLASPGSTIVSASTVDLSTADGYCVPVSGSATVTGLGTEVSGMEYLLTTTGTQVWKNSSALLLPGAADLTAVAGDCLLAHSNGSGNWIIPFFQKLNGQPLVFKDIRSITSTATPTGSYEIPMFSSDSSVNTRATVSALLGSLSASQAQMESASLTSVLATPGNINWHPGAAKAWVSFNGTTTPSIRASYNISSVTRAATGDYTVNFITPFSSINYCANVNCGNADGNGYNGSPAFNATPTGSACRIVLYSTAGSVADVKFVSASFFGDQ